MSTIGIVWFSLSFIGLIGFYESDLEASAGWGMLGMLYAIPLSIVGVIKSKEMKNNNSFNDLLKLNELKEKGIISELEFNAKKFELLKN